MSSLNLVPTEFTNRRLRAGRPYCSVDAHRGPDRLGAAFPSGIPSASQISQESDSCLSRYMSAGFRMKDPTSPDAAAINRRFYNALWADTYLIQPERFNTWPLVCELNAAGLRAERRRSAPTGDRGGAAAAPARRRYVLHRDQPRRPVKTDPPWRDRRTNHRRGPAVSRCRL